MLNMGLAFAILKWLSLFADGKKVGVHLADVSGAFDRVSTPRLLQKLRAKKLPEPMVKVISSWLRQRHAIVAVAGKQSKPMQISNSVCPGTVWGPPLWNLFYEDTQHASSKAGYEEIKYADGLSCFKAFEMATPENEVLASISNCAIELHRWGHANQVLFDPSKEGRAVLSAWSRATAGELFVLLGVIIDLQLTMQPAIDVLAKKCRWKLSSIL